MDYELLKEGATLCDLTGMTESDPTEGFTESECATIPVERRRQLQAERAEAARQDALRSTPTEVLMGWLTPQETEYVRTRIEARKIGSSQSWVVSGVRTPGNDAPEQDARFLAALQGNVTESRRIRGDAARSACRAHDNNGMADGRRLADWVESVLCLDQSVAESERQLATGLEHVRTRPERQAARAERELPLAVRMERMERLLAVKPDSPKSE